MDQIVQKMLNPIYHFMTDMTVSEYLFAWYKPQTQKITIKTRGLQKYFDWS